MLSHASRFSVTSLVSAEDECVFPHYLQTNPDLESDFWIVNGHYDEYLSTFHVRIEGGRLLSFSGDIASYGQLLQNTTCSAIFEYMEGSIAFYLVEMYVKHAKMLVHVRLNN